MNELQVFNNPEFGRVRALMIDGEPWAVGRDVAAALGYTDPAKAIRVHVDPEDKGVDEMSTPGGRQQTTIINESGLYCLILSSKLPGAKRFKRWVTSEVLPALRRTGSYTMEPDAPPTLELTPGDYIRAASILASCQKGRVRSVLTLLERSGLDMSGITVADPASYDPDPYNDPDYREREAQIVEFVNRKVPVNWKKWPLDKRRKFWEGEYDEEVLDLVDRSYISAVEVWCELFNGKPKDTDRHARFINRVLARQPGWSSIQVGKPGPDYPSSRGFKKRSVWTMD